MTTTRKCARCNAVPTYLMPAETMGWLCDDCYRELKLVRRRIEAFEVAAYHKFHLGPKGSKA